MKKPMFYRAPLILAAIFGAIGTAAGHRIAKLPCAAVVGIAVAVITAFICNRCLLPLLENLTAGSYSEPTQADCYKCEDEREPTP